MPGLRRRGPSLAPAPFPRRLRAVTSFGYDPTPFHRFWRIVTADFSLGTWFSVHVRMYWAAVVFMPLIFLARLPSASVGESLVLMTICFVGLFAIIWTHEMGHIACGWHYRIRTDKITLGPLGGLAHLNAPAQTPREELLIALAGPSVHLVWLAMLWPVQWLMPTGTFYPGFTVWYLVVTNQALLLFNLLPIFPLDGGRAARALISMKVHANRATMWVANVGIGGGILLILLAMTRADVWSSIGLLIGLSCIMHSINEKRVARHALIYQRSQRDPWEADPDAWKHGGAKLNDDEVERKPGWLARRRSLRADALAEVKRRNAAELDQKVDAILERVSEVGVGGLTDEEKKTLEQASQKRRGAG